METVLQHLYCSAWPVAVKYSDERPFAGTVQHTNSQHAEERLIGLVLVPPQQRVSCDVEVRKSRSTLYCLHQVVAADILISKRPWLHNALHTREVRTEQLMLCTG